MCMVVFLFCQVAASNDNIHWSSAVQAFTYYDEQPPVVVKGDLLELLLALFAMYCERDDDAPPAYEMGLPAMAGHNAGPILQPYFNCYAGPTSPKQVLV